MMKRAQPETKKLDESAKAYIIRKLRKDPSPEQIPGISNKALGLTVSHESIYQS